jgi:Spy/CpxP family protein refolding chaperone
VWAISGPSRSSFGARRASFWFNDRHSTFASNGCPFLQQLLTAFAAAALVVCASPAFAQEAPQRGAAPAAQEEGVSPAELQRMFDAYALMQAQDQLKISDDRYAQFLARFKGLQDVRRRMLQERVRTIQSLRKLVNDPASDDNQLKDQLKALQELDVRSAVEIKKAYDAVDQVLDTRQQAKFRVFEENMERRKLELIARARQANRARKQM